MPFIKQAISEAKESSAAPEGEYEIRVADVDADYVGKTSGKPSTKILLTIEGDGNYQPINFYLPRPNDDDEEKSAVFKAVMAKRFLVAFNIPHEDDGYDTDDFLGATATLRVSQRVDTKDKDGNPLATPYVSNEVIFPRLVDEPEDKAPAGKGKSAPAKGKGKGR